MREILLRSYDDELESFYYFFNGKYYSDIDLTCELEPSFHDMYFNWNNAEYFTGLLDKNGNKIFEGDVDKSGMIIKFHNNAFQLCSLISREVVQAIPLWCFDNNTFNEIEIIRNIHEENK